MLWTKGDVLSSALNNYNMRVKIAASEPMETPETLKRMSRLVITEESNVETLQDNRKSLKCKA